MTPRTPAQMRELADEHPSHGMYPGTWNHDVVTALRAAADRQEAVEALLEVTPVLMYGIPPKPVDVVLVDDIRKALATTASPPNLTGVRLAQAWRDGYYTGKRDYAGSLMGGIPMSTPNPHEPQQETT